MAARSSQWGSTATIGVEIWSSYPLVNIQKAIEHCHFIVDLPIKHGGSFHSYVNVYQWVPVGSNQLFGRLELNCPMYNIKASIFTSFGVVIFSAQTQLFNCTKNHQHIILWNCPSIIVVLIRSVDALIHLIPRSSLKSQGCLTSADYVFPRYPPVPLRSVSLGPSDGSVLEVWTEWRLGSGPRLSFQCLWTLGCASLRQDASNISNIAILHSFTC